MVDFLERGATIEQDVLANIKAVLPEQVCGEPACVSHTSYSVVIHSRTCCQTSGPMTAARAGVCGEPACVSRTSYSDVIHIKTCNS